MKNIKDLFLKLHKFCFVKENYCFVSLNLVMRYFSLCISWKIYIFVSVKNEVSVFYSHHLSVYT